MTDITLVILSPEAQIVKTEHESSKDRKTKNVRIGSGERDIKPRPRCCPDGR